jgi:L-asparaginase
MNRRILIIYTGGTIGMIKDGGTGVLRPFNLEQILQQVPEINSFGYQLNAIAFESPMDSSNIQPDVWLRLATIIADAYNSYDGFVVLHGSDTMAYTASALSYLLENLGKAVVLTGSQLPIGHVRTDAKENLITSIEIAAATNEFGRSRVPEVCLYFDYQLYRGNRVIKYNSEKFEAFHSPNYPPLAEAGIRIKYYDNYLLPAPNAALKVHKALGYGLATLKLYPGLQAAQLHALLGIDNVQVLVLESFGAGNGPTDAWFLAGLKKFIDRENIILNITQCHGGTVDLGKYETSSKMLEMGILSGFDLTFEAAVTKVMFLLGVGLTGEALKKSLQNSLRGEMSRN